MAMTPRISERNTFPNEARNRIVAEPLSTSLSLQFIPLSSSPANLSIRRAESQSRCGADAGKAAESPGSGASELLAQELQLQPFLFRGNKLRLRGGKLGGAC